MLRKKVLYTIAVSTLLLTTPITAYAQNIESDGTEQIQENESEVQPNGDPVPTNPFEIELILGTQSPWTKKVPITLRFTPKIDSTRTEVSWDYPFGISVQKRYEDFFPAAKGQPFEVKALIVPEEAGTYVISANVTDWGYGSNVTSSADITLTFGNDLVTDPATVGYDGASMIRYLVIFLIIIALAVLGYIGAVKGKVFLKEWLKPPE